MENKYRTGIVACGIVGALCLTVTLVGVAVYKANQKAKVASQNTAPRANASVEQPVLQPANQPLEPVRDVDMLEETVTAAESKQVKDKTIPVQDARQRLLASFAAGEEALMVYVAFSDWWRGQLSADGLRGLV